VKIENTVTLFYLFYIHISNEETICIKKCII